jgi:hypothetical protein
VDGTSSQPFFYAWSFAEEKLCCSIWNGRCGENRCWEFLQKFRFGLNPLLAQKWHFLCQLNRKIEIRNLWMVSGMGNCIGLGLTLPTYAGCRARGCSPRMLMLVRGHWSETNMHTTVRGHVNSISLHGWAWPCHVRRASLCQHEHAGCPDSDHPAYTPWCWHSTGPKFIAFMLVSHGGTYA